MYSLLCQCEDVTCAITRLSATCLLFSLSLSSSFSVSLFCLFLSFLLSLISALQCATRLTRHVIAAPTFVHHTPTRSDICAAINISSSFSILFHSLSLSLPLLYRSLSFFQRLLAAIKFAMSFLLFFFANRRKHCRHL